MNVMKQIAEFFDNLFDTLSGWFNAESKAFLAGARKVEDEIERIGPEMFYEAVNAGLASIADAKGVTGGVIINAADVAIDTLKAQGKTKVTAAVISAVATALTELNAAKGGV